MADYWQWNRAIIEYFTAGTARGTSVFLSVDQEALQDIGEGFLGGLLQAEACDDFVNAVRAKCLVTGMPWVQVEDLKQNRGGLPSGVGFLVLLVYAAYNMQEEEGIDETNYFMRLREVLGLPLDQGRPEGLKPAGVEEGLWLIWNQYLIDAGFEPTAERGSGPQTYLRYVFSQAILRESDKAHLRDRYSEANLASNMDPEQLGFWVSRQHHTRRHLSEGLHHPDIGRVWEFYQAAHRVYELDDWRGPGHGETGPELHRTIECGLYLQESLDGDREYWILPRQPKRSRAVELRIVDEESGSAQTLIPMRAGFFEPLRATHAFVDAPIEYRIIGGSTQRRMVFPRRDFWVLTRDPENPDGAWATWRPYLELGQELMVLCRKGPFAEEMARFQEVGLLQWMEREDEGSYVRFLGCMVLSYDWAGLIRTPECTTLADALAPRSMATIALSHGLRDTNQHAWVEGHPPTMTLYGFENTFEIDVQATRSGRILQSMEIQRQTPLRLTACVEPDTYDIQARVGGQRVASRIFRVVAWEDLQPNLHPPLVIDRNPAATAGLRLRGPLILNADGTCTEVSNG